MGKKRIALFGLAAALLLTSAAAAAEENPDSEYCTEWTDLTSAPAAAEEETAETQAAQAAQRTSVSGGDLAAFTPSAPMELLSESDAQDLEEKMAGYTSGYKGLLQNQAEHYYYYENLDPTAKEIYDVLYGVAQDPVDEGNIGIVMTDMDPSGDEFYYEFNVAYFALTYDHPELFWMYSNSEVGMCYGAEAISQNGFYIVYFYMQEPFTEFEEQMTAFNQAAENFLADIDTGISEYSTVRQIHDKLIELVNYNDPVVENMAYATTVDLAHTAYGALVCDSSGNANYPVCDGYSLAFEYLLQQCGIEALIVTGMAGSSEAEAGGHAWNMVKIGGTWYEVDTTWDDAGSSLDDFEYGSLEYTIVASALSDTEYREAADHPFFLISTDQIRNFVPGENLYYNYYTQDTVYTWCCVSESVHIRFEKDELETDLLSTLESSIISLAPTA